MTYTIKVKNTGDDPLTSIITVDDKCGPLVGPTGDTGSDSILSVGEEWTYTCTKTLTADTTNTATGIGTDSNGGTVDDDDTASVNVINPAIQVTKSVNDNIIYSGGSVTYTIKVKNTGDDPLTTISTVDDKCSPLSGPTGDTGSAGVLSPDEEWTYTCTNTLTADTTNKATATGTDSNGGTVTMTTRPRSTSSTRRSRSPSRSTTTSSTRAAR